MAASYLLLASMLLHLVYSDCYMHMPRGSNNRLNEQSANRNNGNRMFDSQNNNRGGYNVGDLDTTNGFTANDYQATGEEKYSSCYLNNDYNECKTGGNAPTTDTLQYQYEEFYYEGSWMAVTWTNQHGCGNAKLGCQMIFQYGVENSKNAKEAARYNEGAPIGTGATAITTYANTRNSAMYTKMVKMGLRMYLTNGGNTNTPNEQANTDEANIVTTYNNNNNNNRGRHESEEWYSLCRNRKRNHGLFIADQKLNGVTAKYTRQNPGGTRRGLECPEERDYYPYWRPSPFVDVAIITSDMQYCQTVQSQDSQNVKDKYMCTEGTLIPTTQAILDAFNQTECAAAGGTWAAINWGMPAPECVPSYKSDVNHLGNVETPIDGANIASGGGTQAIYMWKLPTVADLKNKMMGVSRQVSVPNTRKADGTAGTAVTRECVRIVARLRYNISTADYDPYMTNYSHSENRNKGIISPIENNPTVDVGFMMQGLRLAINTAQTGRTFQDRSHTMLVCKRPSGIAAGDTILNVQVQGKRGNIVETFPATEYTFSPRQFSIWNGLRLHFQWTGSNTHNNGNPAGDGQAGDSGEGTGGTDRHNCIQMKDHKRSYPIPYDKFTTEDFFQYTTCYHGVLYNQLAYAQGDAQVSLGTGGYYQGRTFATDHYTTITAAGGNARMSVLMNNASPSFRGGAICQINNIPSTITEFSFLCTRNNNFSNRAQKLKMIVRAPKSNGANGASYIDLSMLLG